MGRSDQLTPPPDYGDDPVHSDLETLDYICSSFFRNGSCGRKIGAYPKSISGASFPPSTLQFDIQSFSGRTGTK